MNEHIFQLLVVLGNGIATIAFWSLRQEVKHVKEIVDVQIKEQDRRLEHVENKCLECPTKH